MYNQVVKFYLDYFEHYDYFLRLDYHASKSGYMYTPYFRERLGGLEIDLKELSIT
jgi:hypothetical protein